MSKYAPGHAPDIYAAWGWLAGQVTYAGLEKIKGPITRDAFVTQLEALRNFDTIGGKINYSAQRHEGSCCQLLGQTKGGNRGVVPDKTVNGQALE